jgi:hypothetical protein
MGRLTIALTGTGTSGEERTLLPNAPGSFSKYELVFTPEDGQNGIDPVTLTSGTSYTLTLPVGNWTITALAYVRIQGVPGVTDGDYVAARGSEFGTIGSTLPVRIHIDLRGGVDAGQGILRYDIALPGDLDSAALEILPLEGGSPVKTVDLKTAASGSLVLDSGYYLLKISRVKGGNTTVRGEVVHIYEGWATEAAGPGYDFTGLGSVAEIVGYLSSQPVNTINTPYMVILSSDLDLEDFMKDGVSLTLLYEALDGKYVSLDLSACKGDILLGSGISDNNQDKIVSLTLPDSLTSIGDYIFYGCSSLASVDLPESLTFIGDSAFRDCSSLTAVDLPDSLISIGDSAFSGCSSLASVDLPDSLTFIGGYAFSGCSSLAAIDLPESLTSIGGAAFSGCSSLASVDLPDSLTSIRDYAFSGCSSLASVDLPNFLSSIGREAFNRCSSLASIDLPDSLSSIGIYAFGGCSSLTAIDLPDSLTSIEGYAFYGCSSLASIDLPDSLTSIGDDTFSGCSSLAAVDLPDSLTSIGKEAFYHCSSLASIDLPDSLTSIGYSVFYGCSSLASITSRNTTPPSLDHGVFSETSSSLSISVPGESVAAYKSAWSDYAGKITSL